jgi:hypothetical protein
LSVLTTNQRGLLAEAKIIAASIEAGVGVSRRSTTSATT